MNLNLVSSGMALSSVSWCIPGMPGWSCCLAPSTLVTNAGLGRPRASAALPTGAATHQYPATIVPGPHPQRAGKHVTRWQILLPKRRFSPTYSGPSCIKSWHRLHIFVSISDRGRMGKTWVGVRKVSKGWHSTSERNGEDGSRRWLLLWEEIISPGDTGNLSPSHSLQRWQIWFRKDDKYDGKDDKYDRKDDKYIWTSQSFRRQDPNNKSEPGRSVTIISWHFIYPIIWNFTDIKEKCQGSTHLKVSQFPTHWPTDPLMHLKIQKCNNVRRLIALLGCVLVSIDLWLLL